MVLWPLDLWFLVYFSTITYSDIFLPPSLCLLLLEFQLYMRPLMLCHSSWMLWSFCFVLPTPLSLFISVFRSFYQSILRVTNFHWVSTASVSLTKIPIWSWIIYSIFPISPSHPLSHFVFTFSFGTFHILIIFLCLICTCVCVWHVI